jgi:hypothetical protein
MSSAARFPSSARSRKILAGDQSDRVLQLRRLLHRIFSGPAASYFLILRNDEALPDGLSGRDLDVCVRPHRTADEVVEYLSECGRELGWVPVSVSTRPHMVGLTLVRQDRHSDEGVHFDVFDGISFAGMPLCAATELDNESEVRDGARVLSRRGRALATILHHMAWNGYLGKDKYRTEVAQVLADPIDAAWLHERLTRVFGEGATRRLLASASTSRLDREHGASRVRVCAAIFAHRAPVEGLRPAKEVLAYWAGQRSSLQHPPGLVGMDGDFVPRAPRFRLSTELACVISPHGYTVPSVRSRATHICTINGDSYERVLRSAWKRWTVVRWVAPSSFLYYQAKRNRVVVLTKRLPLALRVLRAWRRPAWVGVPLSQS